MSEAHIMDVTARRAEIQKKKNSVTGELERMMALRKVRADPPAANFHHQCHELLT